MYVGMKRALSHILIVGVISSLMAAGNGCANNEFNATKYITVVAREDGSGTKSAFMEIIGLKNKSDPSGAIIHVGTAGVLTEITSNPTAIAYESLGYVAGDVKILKVGGVEATATNIKNGTYPLSRPLSVIYKESTLDSDINKAFLAFLCSSDAQNIILSCGYVSIINGALSYISIGTLSGRVSVSGSTALQPLMIELAAEFTRLQPNIVVEISGGGSGTGYKNAENGVSGFGMISETFSSEKAPSCTEYVVCMDGIVVIVNKNNPLDTISMGQLKNVYDAEAGLNAITKWSSLLE